MSSTQSIIYFYDHLNNYYIFSNFYPTTFVSNELKYCCSEQYFMKKKQELFDPFNILLANKIMQSNDPVVIKRYGRSVNNFKESIWSMHKYQIMLDALRFKFGQNQLLLDELLNTTDSILVEASPTDKIWGIGISINDAKKGIEWKGQNLLGKALMEIRKEFEIIKSNIA